MSSLYKAGETHILLYLQSHDRASLTSLQKQDSVPDSLALSQPNVFHRMHAGGCLSGLLQCELLHAGFFYHYVLDKNGTVWCMRNVLARLLVTTIYMAIITLIAAMIPFFGCVPHFLCSLWSTANVLGAKSLL